MQFGLFSVGDVTMDPTTGRTPSEGERIHAMTQITLKAEEVGLDVFATGAFTGNPLAVTGAEPGDQVTLVPSDDAHTVRMEVPSRV